MAQLMMSSQVLKNYHRLPSKVQKRVAELIEAFEQIRQYAQGILEGLEVDDLNGGTVVTDGDHSLFKGPEPSLRRVADAQAEADALQPGCGSA